MQRQPAQISKGKWGVEIVTEAHPYTQLWVRAACYRRSLTLYGPASKRHPSAYPRPLQRRAVWGRCNITGEGRHISREIHRLKGGILSIGNDCGPNLRLG